MKHCKFCDTDKPEQCFRFTTNDRGYKFRINKCKECCAKWAKEYRTKNPEKQKEVIKKYRLKNREFCNYLARKYYIKNDTPEKRAKRRIDQKNHILKLTDAYVVRTICKHDKKKEKELIYQHPELIEAKRQQIILNRLINQKQQL